MFYAIPPNLTSPEGDPVNALFGVTKTLISLVGEYRPDYLVLATEGGGKSFREDIYPDYKSDRDGMPDDLRNQIEPIFVFAELLGIPVIAYEKHEADDVIGTLATHIRSEHPEITTKIMSGDKDLYQFVGGNILMYDPIKKLSMGHTETVKKFGVEPVQILDLLGLIGDKSDCIPGIPGVGPKTAEKLLSSYGDMDGIYENIEKVPGKLGEKLKEHKDVAYLSKRLATIITDLPVTHELSYFGGHTSNAFLQEGCIDFLKKYGFDSLIPEKYKVKNIVDVSAIDVQPIEDLDGIMIENSSELYLHLGDDVITVRLDKKYFSGHITSLDAQQSETLLEHLDKWIGYGLKDTASALKQRSASIDTFANTLFS